ncbi:MAG: sulfatase-like hydrolase/transferase [Bacteroidales bacterium]|nr:sulfatase-like hydrolase/transferase [Bacteroidales bacterium]
MAFLALFITSCRGVSEKSELQNVIIIIADDHAVTAAGCYGNNIIRTPNIDRLAEGGLLFENAYSNAPVCSASRQSILTGKYPHATGVTLLTTSFPDTSNITLAEHLRELGYSTGVVGKTHFNNRTDPLPDHGFSSVVPHGQYRQWLKDQDMQPVPDTVDVLPPWKPFRDPARVWLNADVLPTAVREEFGSAAFDAMKAVEFLRQNRDTSFFLIVGFHEPHSPFNFPVEYASRYDPADMQLPQGSPEDDRFVPAIFRDLTDEDKRGIIASYYTSTEYMDHYVGEILDATENLGLDENTLIVYMGDQGYLLGDHKRFEKHTMWDPAIKAPLIMRPGNQLGKGIRTEALVQFIDIAPTILELLDLPFLETVQGKSKSYLLDHPDAVGNDYVFAEFLEDNKAMITDGRWKYIYTTGKYDLGQGYETGEGPSGILHRLYDLKNDPEESVDVSGIPANKLILSNLQNEMLRIFQETYSSIPAAVDSMTIEEKLAWFCVPRDVGSQRGVE